MSTLSTPSLVLRGSRLQGIDLPSADPTPGTILRRDRPYAGTDRLETSNTRRFTRSNGIACQHTFPTLHGPLPLFVSRLRQVEQFLSRHLSTLPSPTTQSQDTTIDSRGSLSHSPLSSPTPPWDPSHTHLCLPHLLGPSFIFRPSHETLGSTVVRDPRHPSLSKFLPS